VVGTKRMVIPMISPAKLVIVEILCNVP
jgi:hypothetical protein